MDKINNSVIANNNSTITNADINTKTYLKGIKFKYSIIGFLSGMLSSIVASYLYDLYKQING